MSMTVMEADGIRIVKLDLKGYQKDEVVVTMEDNMVHVYAQKYEGPIMKYMYFQIGYTDDDSINVSKLSYAVEITIKKNKN